MKGEIIAVGDELTSGRILNTTSSFAAGHLYGAGHEILSMATVGDEPESIESALRRALRRADFVIVTGGLGATSDDRTNEVTAKVLDRPTTFHPEIFARICAGSRQALREDLCSRFAEANDEGEISRPFPEMDEKEHPLAKLAWLPHGSTVLKPEARMAGHLLIHEGTPIFFLPGVPHEMRELMLECVLPYLSVWQAEKDGRTVRQKIYRLFGPPETEINRKLAHLEGIEPDVRIGYYPVYPEVHVSLSVAGQGEARVDALFTRFDGEIRRILAHDIYGEDDESMESVIGRLLTERKERVFLAESCTGGLISYSLTRVPGSSAYLLGGAVAYANELKQSLLGVSPETLVRHGAVSGETAVAMAQGACRISGAEWAISVTGIAGPTGGSEEKPVGLVYIGLAGIDGVSSHAYQFSGNRWQIQAITAETALDLLRRRLLAR